jgi:hypothetical protein
MIALQPRVAIPPPFRSADDVVMGLAELDRRFQAARDTRGLFVMAYVATTSTIAQWIARGAFLDNQAMARYVVAFGNAYRRALANFDAGDYASVPVAWQQSFVTCRARSGSVYQSLMLGINAHINHDLPYAVIESGIDVNSCGCYKDYVRIDDVLRLNIRLSVSASPMPTGRSFHSVEDGFAASQRREWLSALIVRGKILGPWRNCSLAPAHNRSTSGPIA